VKSTLTEAEKLQQILERMLVDYTKGSSKKRVWKALVGRDERHMVASLDRLEKEKSALVLCIGFTHAETLGTIRDSVGELIPKINSMDRGFTVLSRRFPGGNKHRGREVSSDHECPAPSAVIDFARRKNLWCNKNGNSLLFHTLREVTEIL
jgi:hypothetical protein